MDKYIKNRELIVIAFSFFIFMMILNLMHSNLWGDEWVEYYYSQASIRDGDLYNRIISTFQPPLYNFLMHFWLKINDSLLWFRFFNVICGSITGLMIFDSVKNLTDFKCASFTIIGLGCTYHWIYCIQECSEYALMLMFLSLSINFFLKCFKKYDIKNLILFIFSCIAAMYSQYGAFFVVLPLLLFYYVAVFLNKNKKEILSNSIIYLVVFFIFALPLYLFFARIQINNNRISDYMQINIGASFFIEIFYTFGEIIAYFFNIQFSYWTIILRIFGIILILFSFILIKRTAKFEIKYIILVLITSYILYYFLVSFKIYGMTHANESAGFYSRYSYFFIPIFSIALPLMIHEVRIIYKKNYLQLILQSGCVISLIISLFMSFPAVINNWNKAFDEEMVKIWIYNEGFTDTTYLLGGGIF